MIVENQGNIRLWGCEITFPSDSQKMFLPSETFSLEKQESKTRFLKATRPYPVPGFYKTSVQAHCEKPWQTKPDQDTIIEIKVEKLPIDINELSQACKNAIADEADNLTFVQDHPNNISEKIGILGSLGVSANCKGQYQQSIDYLLLAEEATDQSSVTTQRRGILLNLAISYHAYATYDLSPDKQADGFQQAVDTYGRALDMNNQLTNEEESVNQFYEAAILNGLGVSLTALGNCEQAIEKIDQASTIFEAIGNEDGIATAKYNLGQCGVSR